MSNSFEPRDWTGMPVPERRAVVGPFERSRPLWQELLWLAVALLAGILIGHMS